MSRLDRREFLKTGAAVITLPILTHGSEGKKPKAGPPDSRYLEENPSLFKLVLVTDSHVRLEKNDPQNLYPSDKYANDKNRYVVEQINKVNPDLVIHLGDIPHTIPASENHDQAMKNAHTIYSRIKSPLYVVAGNHDIGNKPNAFTSSPIMDENSHAIFEKYWGPTYSSFDYENCHFTLISSSVLDSGLPLEAAQKSWLIDDLEKAREANKRIFWCMHHPLFINHPSENEHYDNIGEPSRSWLLSLLDQYEVEAVFAGHAHNYFYNLYGNTDLYALPSITFVRPDFSAMFHVAPADEENGRNDVNKLGFSLLDVKKVGSRLSTIRTYGLTREHENTVISMPVSLSKKSPPSPVTHIGTTLRHSWAKTMYMPCDSLDEFSHKPIRNDYLLQALEELSIIKLRIPIGDLADHETLARIKVLKRLGYHFTVFSIGIPNRSAKNMIFKHKNLINTWEVTVPRRQVKGTIQSLKEVKTETAVSIFLSTLDTIDDQKQEEDYVFSHFPTHGFKLREYRPLKSYIDNYKAREAIHGFVMSVNAEMKIWESLRSADEMMKKLGMKGIVHFNMPRKTEAIPFVDDLRIASVVGEAFISSIDLKNIEVSLDTLVDHDRGYFPRNGLIDRRYNPRPAYHVLRHLHHAVSGNIDTLDITRNESESAVRSFHMHSREFQCVFVIPGDRRESIEIEFSRDIEIGNRNLKHLDLLTGRIKNSKCTFPAKNRIIVTKEKETNHPFLLLM